MVCLICSVASMLLLKKQPSRCAKFRLLTTMKQPIYNNRNATNDKKIQENLVTKTNTLTVRSIEQDLERVHSVTKTNMADYLVEPKQSRSAGLLREGPVPGKLTGNSAAVMKRPGPSCSKPD